MLLRGPIRWAGNWRFSAVDGQDPDPFVHEVDMTSVDLTVLSLQHFVLLCRHISALIFVGCVSNFEGKTHQSWMPLTVQ